MLLFSAKMLWMLAIVPFVVVAELRRTRNIASSRRTHGLLALLRSVMLVSLIFAAARPALEIAGSNFTTVAVIDLSRAVGEQPAAIEAQVKAAIEDARIRSKGHSLRIIAFSNRARNITDLTYLADANRLSALRTELAQPLWSDDPKEGGANIASAVQLAGAEITADGKGDVFVYSPMQPTRGDVAAECVRLARRGIAVAFHPEIVTGPPKVILCNVRVPPAGRIGETVLAQLVIESEAPTHAIVDVESPQHSVDSIGVDLPGTAHQMTVPVHLRAEGLNTFSFRVRGKEDAAVRESGDGALSTSIFVSSPLRVAVVQSSKADTTAGALRALLGGSAIVSSQTPAFLGNSSGIANQDVVVVSDVPATELSIVGIKNLSDATLGGTGLFFTGSANAFGPGGWSEPTLAEMLPVNMSQRMTREDPSTTLVFVVDTSGSMSGLRITIAKEIVRLALRQLQPQDLTGIVEFFGSKRWAAPIQPATNSLELDRALNRLDAGGGTVILPAIEEAAFALRNVNTRTRHILILSDGGVENGPFEPLIRKMANEGITVSTVLCGPGQSDFFSDIAQWGNGQAYNAPDRFSLPEILLRQPQTSVPSPWAMTPTSVTIGSDPLLRTLDLSAFEKLPAIEGYVRSALKSRADVLLRTTTTGDPILARWRYGIGWIAVLPAQLGSTSTALLGKSPQFQKMMRALFRSIAKRGDANNAVQMTALYKPSGLEIDIETIGDSQSEIWKNEALVLIARKTGAGDAQSMLVQPISNSRWNGLFDSLQPGNYTIQATIPAANGQPAKVVGTIGATISQPRIFSALFDGSKLAKQLTDESERETAEWNQKSAITQSITEIYPVFVVFGVLAFLAHVWVRRRNS